MGVNSQLKTYNFLKIYELQCSTIYFRHGWVIHELEYWHRWIGCLECIDSCDSVNAQLQSFWLLWRDTEAYSANERYSSFYTFTIVCATKILLQCYLFIHF